MQLPGIVTVKPEDTETIKNLASMMGKSFLEELWTGAWLDTLDAFGASKERRIEICRAIMKYDFIVGAPYQCCYMLPDVAAGAGAYLASDLQGRTWNELEEESYALMAKEILSEAEALALSEQAEKMHVISDFSWAIDHAEGHDFIHFFSLGVNSEMRGSGAFRRLMTPFFIYADEHGINCYLECYSDHLEGLYGHFGFETVKRLSDPAFSITERCMVRTPRRA